MIAWWFSGSLDGCGRPRFDVQMFASPLDLIIFQQLLKCTLRAGWVHIRIVSMLVQFGFYRVTDRLGTVHAKAGRDESGGLRTSGAGRHSAQSALHGGAAPFAVFRGSHRLAVWQGWVLRIGSGCAGCGAQVCACGPALSLASMNSS